MTDPTTQAEDEAVTTEVQQILREEFELAMNHEFDGALGSPEAIKRLSRQFIRVEMSQFIVRLQAKGLDRMARD